MRANDEPRIDSDTVEQAQNIAEDHPHMTPEGDYVEADIQSPRLDDRQPAYLRMYLPRKSTKTAQLLEELREECGLFVVDVWQYDGHSERDDVALMFKPKAAVIEGNDE